MSALISSFLLAIIVLVSAKADSEEAVTVSASRVAGNDLPITISSALTLDVPAAKPIVPFCA